MFVASPAVVLMFTVPRTDVVPPPVPMFVVAPASVLMFVVPVIVVAPVTFVVPFSAIEPAAPHSLLDHMH